MINAPYLVIPPQHQQRPQQLGDWNEIRRPSHTVPLSSHHLMLDRTQLFCSSEADSP